MTGLTLDDSDDIAKVHRPDQLTGIVNDLQSMLKDQMTFAHALGSHLAGNPCSPLQRCSSIRQDRALFID